MHGKIVVTSAYPEFTKMVEEVAAQLSIELLVVEAVLEDALEQVEKLMDKYPVDVLVSRGGTGELLRKKFSAPVVSASSSESDILLSLARAREYSPSIGYFSYPGIDDAGFLYRVEAIIGIPVKHYPYRNAIELAAQMEKAHRDGCEAIVGGGHQGVYLARAYGMEGFVIYSSRNTVASALQRARDIASLRGKERTEEVKQLRLFQSKGLVTHYSFSDLAGGALQDTVEKAKRFSKVDATVLIWGESGTGKELFAHSIHAVSSRQRGPFVAVNCAALPESLLESELFGYEEGAFTGAKKGGRSGLFEQANGGTIFLDEIGKMTFKLQAHLLRVLQTKEVRRIGGDRVTPVDVRVIAASNEVLHAAVEKGEFRSDLYYRLNVLNLRIPPLKERLRDIPELVQHICERLGKKLGYIPEIHQDFFAALNGYHWPGNVRELENILERYAILVGPGNNPYLEDWLSSFPEFDQVISSNQRDEAVNCGPVEREQSIAKPQGAVQKPEVLASPVYLSVNPGTLEEMEKQIIRILLERYEGNRTLLADKLGISRTTLWKKLQSDCNNGNVLPH